MSLTYDLRMSTRLDPVGVSSLLLESKLGLLPSATQTKLSGTGVTVSVTSEGALGKTIVKESYGIDSTVRVNFDLDKFGEFEAGLQTTVMAAMSLMTTTDSDGVLLFEHDTPVLMRKNGKLILDPGPGFWADLPRLLNRSYEFGDLPLPK